MFLSLRHGCVNASLHFYCAAPCCGTLYAKSSYRRCRLGPLAERGREALQVWRYWGRLEAMAPAQSGGGGSVTRYLVTLLRSRDVKVQALGRLGQIPELPLPKITTKSLFTSAKAPTSQVRVFHDHLFMVSSFCDHSRVSGHPRLALGLSKYSSVDVQLATCLP